MYVIWIHGDGSTDPTLVGPFPRHSHADAWAAGLAVPLIPGEDYSVHYVRSPARPEETGHPEAATMMK